MDTFIQNLETSLHRGFIDRNQSQAGNFLPRLLVNNYKENESVLTTLVEELTHCESFMFSVAFITESGLATLKSHLLDLHQKGIKGRLLTSTFLNFNQPKIFKELLKLQNVEIRLTDLEGFHSKGYIFKQPTHYSLIVGSSNLTAHALKVNYEWNVKLTTHENGDIVHHFKNQFQDVWTTAKPLTNEWIEAYEKNYTRVVDPKLIHQVIELPQSYEPNAMEDALKIKPNKMQQAALQQIQAVRDAGQDKGLIISATGTGKTYLSAFDVRRFQPKRLLFIVHREQILQKALSDYKRILGGLSSDYGILSGNSRKMSAKYLFATIQTISKDNHLNSFDPNEFDYILIDEVHKAGALSYRRVIDYFQPTFFMGMTATPERTDDFNIYDLFDYNVAYEIRLQEALEEDMLCPFHYFGVTDFEFGGQTIDETTQLTQLVTEERVEHMIEKIIYYGHSGEKVKGLMFCSRKDEAKKLSKLLNERCFRTVALTGDSSQEEREHAVAQLEEGQLEYILTVDIFNEGIDIPCINQVVMLRQTQSSIIFIQQLGRGLRKHDTKEYVTVIDFIGNYKNNYLIPIALSGDQSQNKDNIRRHTMNTNYIKGVSTINFEEIAKARVFKAINNSNLTALKVMREAYRELKNRLGRIPNLYDFITNHSIDPMVIVGKYTNHYQFLLKMNEEIPVLSSYENSVLSMASTEFINGKRKHELILLDMMLNQGMVDKEEYRQALIEASCRVDDDTIMSIERIFDLSFFTQGDQKKYGGEAILLKDGQIYRWNTALQARLTQNEHFRDMVQDVIQTGFAKSANYQPDQSLSLYKKYSRKDICRLLNWHNDEKATIYGYKTKHQTCPIFITYHKDDAVDSSIQYEDEFLDPQLLRYYTKNNRTLQSGDVKSIVESQQNNVDLHILVKKDDDEGSDFYYLGKAFPDQKTVEQTQMNDGKSVVRMNMIMEQPIESQLYHYIVDGLV